MVVPTRSNENLARPRGCRRYARNGREGADVARQGRREGAEVGRNRFRHHQRPAAARHVDADRPAGAADSGGRIQWRNPRQARHDDPGTARACRRCGAPWPRVHWFWGDERFVPQDDPDSNYRMARDALLSRVPIPSGNIHPIPTEGLSAEEAAAAYEATLKEFYGADVLAPDRPLFDVTLLGFGENGHTASLFPGQALQEKRRWAVAVGGADAEPRITLTYPVLDSSRDVAFLATGAGKRDVVARARAGDRALPAALVRPIGRLHWFTDRAAAPGGT
jgi:6-phosphogluconolactonase